MNQAPQTPNFGSFGTAGQAATPPYAPPSMNVPPAVPRVPPVDNGIQWGKVLKGVAKVTAVAVAVVVAGWALYSIAGAVFGAEAVSGTLATGAHYVGGALEWLGGIVGPLYHQTVGFVGGLLNSMGFGVYSFASGTGATVASGAAIATGATLAAATVPAATHMFNDMGSHQTLLAKSAAANHLTSHSSHIATDLARDAAEHSHKSFAERHASSRPTTGNFTDRINAGRTTSIADRSPAPRDTSFAKQLDADRDALAAALDSKQK